MSKQHGVDEGQSELGADFTSLLSHIRLEASSDTATWKLVWACVRSISSALDLAGELVVAGAKNRERGVLVKFSTPAKGL